MKIWQRYFITQAIKLFFVILISFYLLYFLIDYASRAGSAHHHGQLKVAALMSYYFFEFVQRLDVLVPFAWLVAVIRTLTQLNMQNELVAMLAAGLSLKSLLRPFVLIGLILVCVVYVNYQFAIPLALKEMRHMQDVHALKKNKKRRKLFVQSVALTDHSILLFQDFDTAAKKFSDVYWIKSFNEIYHMKDLSTKTSPPVGNFVDHLVRSQSQIEKIASFRTKVFPEIKFNKKVLLDTIIPAEELSLTELWRRIPVQKAKVTSEKEAEIATVFYQKLATPWLAILAVLGPAPFCIRFSRYFPVFFIYGLSIFGLAACYIVFDAAVVLGSRQVISPFWAIAAPFLFFMSIATLRFIRIR